MLTKEEKVRQSRSKATRKWQQKQRKQGLCICCRRPAEPDRIRCFIHLDQQAEYMRNIRQLKKSNMYKKGLNKNE